MFTALAGLEEGLANCADAPAWALCDADLVECLEVVHRADARLAAVKARLVRELDARTVTQHAPNTAMWLRERLRIDIHTAKRLVALAGALDRSPALDQALGAGLVNPEQVAVVAAALRDLPAEAGADVAAKAEAMLIDYAGQFEPAVLRKLGTRILAHVAPEVSQRVEAQALARQDERAHANRAFHLSSTGDGRVRLSGWLDNEAAAVVNAALDPLCAPTTGPDGGREDRTPAQRRADALLEICELAMHTGQLPVNGGDRAQVVVTVPFDVLRHQLGTATLDTGETLSPEQVRRMACDARILPAVLGGDGQVLDLGQSRRLISGPLRRALVLRDGGCAFPGCDRPARWCHGHHIRSWAVGGATSLDNAVLLCGHHHRLIHRGEWTVQLGHDRRPEFLPPTHIDPQRRPRRNSYHRRR